MDVASQVKQVMDSALEADLLADDLSMRIQSPAQAVASVSGETGGSQTAHTENHIHIENINADSRSGGKQAARALKRELVSHNFD